MAEQTNAPAGTAKTGDVQKGASRMLRPYEEMERVFDDIFSRGWLRPLRERRATGLGLPQSRARARLGDVGC